MAVKLFASILIGSTETEMKLFQLSPRKGMLQLSCQSRRIDLGSDAYARGTLSTARAGGLTWARMLTHAERSRRKRWSFWSAR